MHLNCVFQEVNKILREGGKFRDISNKDKEQDIEKPLSDLTMIWVYCTT